jgi:hypothetical protein
VTRSLKNSCALIALTAATMLSGIAQAQDVVVMRRPIAPPNRMLEGVNAPSTPTPTPTPTASPTPADTATYKLVVRTLGDPFNYYTSGTSRYANAVVPANEVTVAVSDTSCVNASDGNVVSVTKCRGMGGPSINDRSTLPAQMDADLRAVYVTRAALQGIDPAIGSAELDRMCNSSIVIGPSGSTQTWKLSCDPKSVVNSYERFVYGLGDPFNYFASSAVRYANTQPSGTTVKLAVVDARCWDNATNAYASDQSRCTNLVKGYKATDRVTVGAAYSQNLRTIAISKAEVLSLLPHYTQSVNTGDLNQMCNSSLAIGTSAGGTVNYKLRCDPAEVSEHYERFAYGLGDPFNYYATSSARYQNQSPAATTVNIALADVRCWDTATNAYASDQSKCTYLPTGANVYDLVNVPATFSQNLRTIAIDKADILAKLPHYTQGVNTSDLNNLCNSTVTVGTSAGGTANYKLRCDPKEVAETYERFVYGVGDPFNYYASSATRYQNPSTTGTTLKLAASDVRCWDTATKAYASDQSKCTYLPTGVNVYDVFTVAATISQNLRTVAIDKAEVLAKLPHYTQGVNTGDLNNLCNGSVYFGTASNGVVSYKLRCSPADVAEHYERFAYGLGDPFNYYANSAQRYQNPSPTATTVNIAVSDARCWDTDTDGYASDQSKCTYLQTGINTNDLVNVSATISQNLRTIAISKAEVLAKLPHYTTKVNTGDLNNLCTSDLRIGTSSGTTSYKLRCDPAEVSEHYERYVYAWGDPYSYFKTVGDRFKNPSSTATSVVLAAADVRCWDTTAKAYAADQSKCTYLPTGPNAPDQYTVAATFDSTARTITMLRSDLQALSPNMTNAYLNAVCSATTQVGTSGTTVSYSNKCQ